jgi:hypothetical protein
MRELASEFDAVFNSFRPLNQSFDFSHASTMKRPSKLPIVPFAWYLLHGGAPGCCNV